ncbi:MAG: hypothetical protein ACOX5R_07160, partial [bacterium]
MTISNLKDKLESIGPNLLIETIIDVFKGTIKPKKQPTESPTIRARRIKLRDYYGIIDWNQAEIQLMYKYFLNETLRLDLVFSDILILKVMDWRPVKIVPNKESKEIKNVGKLKIKSINKCSL